MSSLEEKSYYISSIKPESLKQKLKSVEDRINKGIVSTEELEDIVLTLKENNVSELDIYSDYDTSYVDIAFKMKPTPEMIEAAKANSKATYENGKKLAIDMIKNNIERYDLDINDFKS